MRLLSFTAITEVVQGFSLSPILEASVDSCLSWGLLGWRGGSVLRGPPTRWPLPSLRRGSQGSVETPMQGQEEHFVFC